jgi:prepilin-type N-terminal cleavage/methylation domain-containing protein
MNKKAFSLIEIIFVLFIIAVIITAAVSKFGTTLNNTYMTKLKSDVLQIRSGINQYKNSMILKNKNDTLNQLDDNDAMLFNLILQTPILASSNNKADSWNKISATKYTFYINNQTFLTFNYNATNFTFDCDNSNELCKELNL